MGSLQMFYFVLILLTCICCTLLMLPSGKICSRFEFECANRGQPLTYPQCVAIYDTCDGIEHCEDGSDEQNCPGGPGITRKRNVRGSL